MYAMLLNLWQTGRATTATIGSAVARGWITAEQGQTIITSPQQVTPAP
jgi:hypothetical protein